MVITFENVSFRYTDKMLINNVSFSLTDDMKIGIVGSNGSGKTTILKLILGEEVPNSGNIIKTGGMIINYLPQDPNYPKELTIMEVINQNSNSKHPINDYEIKSILNKLGLSNHNLRIENLSGGEIRRLALANALVSYSDILILDEPTNHLDNELIVWLEKYLMKFKKGLVMVTHDRYFLERVCNRMLEIDNQHVYLYEANYAKFLELKALRLEQESKIEHKLKAILKKEAEWLGRGVEARRTKSKSRIERFNELAKTTFKEEKSMSFSSVETYLGKELIEIKNASKSFDNKVLFKDFNFRLQRDDIVGIVGENGCGKTTLFKIIMSLETLDSGELFLGQTLKIGYLPQKLAEDSLDIRAIDYLKEEKNIVETLNGTISVNDLMDQFLFSDDLKYSKLKNLSGGERRRLELIKVLMTNPNLLILDEPTNDLDIYTIELLEDFLLDFKGPVLVVSHDRYFLDKLCSKLLVYENSNIKEYQIAFSEYLELDNKKIQVNTVKGIKPKGDKLPAAIRNEHAKLELEIKEFETKIEEINKEKSSITTDYKKLLEYENELAELNTKLDSAITRFLELEEIIENHKN